MIAAEIEAPIRKDAFASWLRATIEIIEPGSVRVSLTVTKAMLNFHGMTHGDLVFALDDIAFAAASNSHGQTALALNVTTSFLRPIAVGDHLVAEAKKVQQDGATALYDILVTEQNSKRGSSVDKRHNHKRPERALLNLMGKTKQ